MIALSHLTMTQTPPDPSWFSDISVFPLQESYAVQRQYLEDSSRYKLNFSFPCYRDEDGTPWVLPVLKSAERALANEDYISTEFMITLGYDSFNQQVVKMLVGEGSKARINNTAFAVQTITTVAGLRVGAEFLCDSLGMTTAYATEPFIEFCDCIFLRAGFKHFKPLRYVTDCMSLNVDGFLKDLSSAEPKSVVLLQASGHDPTGFDPSPSLWQKIADIMKERRLFPFFMVNYQGMVSGDMAKDVEPIRIFEQNGLEFFCVHSFLWVMGLYKDRVASLIVVLNRDDQMYALKSHLQQIIESMYATPPGYGARAITYILQSKMLLPNFKESLRLMADRLRRMRSYLQQELLRLGTPGKWFHITSQAGLFCYTGLNTVQVDYLRKHHQIYLLRNGRMNVSGLNLNNVSFVAKAIFDTLSMLPDVCSIKMPICDSNMFHLVETNLESSKSELNESFSQHSETPISQFVLNTSGFE